MADQEKKHRPPPPQAAGEEGEGEGEGEEEEEEEEEEAARRRHRDFNHEHTQGRGPPRMADQKRRARDYDHVDTCRRVSAVIATLLLLAGITALIIYLVYRPHKPQFSVVGAAIYNLNATAPPLISTNMQFTIVTRNPNHRVSIYYDRLSVYVAYHNQAITLPLALPPLHQKKRATVAVSPVLGGTAVPVAQEVANGLAADEAYGVVGLRVVIMGRLRWKAGAIRTGHYGLNVRCDVLVGMRRGGMGQPPLQGPSRCKVDV